MDEALRPKNLTPWTVFVYSGFAHWDKPIEEFQESFCTKEGAETYAGTIKRYNPGYRTKIKKED